MTSLTKHTSRKIRSAGFAVAIIAALTLAPGATAFADDMEGPPGDNVVTGTNDGEGITGDPNVDGGDNAVVDGGDDTIDGKGGDDSILGDAVAQGDATGTVIGGDDTIEGGSGTDIIAGDGAAFGDRAGSVNGGDDTIDGGADPDLIYGDGVAGSDLLATILGGDDTIHGGGGDDTIIGDGETNADTAAGVDGGDDILFGDAGDDEIYGDGFADANLIDLVVGGDDQLFGGEGEDHLDGQGGNDLLCGLGGGQANTENDILVGGEGSDLACAVDDDVVAQAGVQDVVELALNDEQLNDEGDGDGLLQYTLGAITGGILQAIIDATTGELTFTAECDGSVGYTVTRDDVDASELATSAIVTIDVSDEAAACHPVVHEFDDAPVAGSVSATAVLPDTGASTGLNAIGASGLGLLVGGIAMIVVASRRRVLPKV